MKPEMLQKLVGKKITNICTDGDGTYGFVLNDGTVAWVLCDEEGNGPGYLDIVAPVFKPARRAA